MLLRCGHTLHGLHSWPDTAPSNSHKNLLKTTPKHAVCSDEVCMVRG